MSQNPPWPPQSGSSAPDPRRPSGPPQQGGYPQQGGGYPQNYPQQGSYPPPNYPQQGQPAGGYQPQSYLGPFQGQQPQGGYPGQGGQGGYQPPPSGPYGAPPRMQPPRRSPGLIIGIVVAAVVLLVAVGGILMALGGRGGDEPVTTITPTPLPVPTDDPTTQPTPAPTPRPSQPAPPSGAPPTTAPPTKKPTPPSSGDAIDLGNGVKLTPADDWQVRSKKKNAVQLANGRDIFLGIAVKDASGSNPAQTCDSYHRQVAKDYTNGKFSEPKKVDLGTTKLSGATCAAQVTVANGGDALKVYIYSLVSIRSDGLTVVGSLYFTKDSDIKSLDKDFSAMVNSMLRTQVAGG